MNSFWKRRVSSLLLLAALSCAAFLSVPAPAAAVVAPTNELGGKHWRFDTTSNGPVHVWVPSNYDPGKAITVVHVHGDAEVKTLSSDCQGGRVDYVTPYTSGKYSDAAWVKMKLAEQFNATGLNAMFIFPDGPVSQDERREHTRVWKSLDTLLTTVKTQVGQVVPDKIVVSGHSGAYETMHHWTGEKRVAAFVLLDSTYGGASTWSGWFNGADTRKLAVIHTGDLNGSGTTAKTAKSIATSTKAKIIASIPGSSGELATQAGSARAVVIHSQFCHSDIVRLGSTIPVVLPWAAGTAVAQSAGTGAPAPQDAGSGATAGGANARIVAPLPQSYGGPRLEIPIPNVDFTEAIRADDTITFPWIAQYIGGVYTFLISIVGLVAAVMMIIGGFQYVTSAGDKGKVAIGKKRITNALTGLVLALGSYTILYTINPDLLKFDGLKVLGVQTDSWDSHFDATLGTTEEVTSDETSEGAGDYAAVGACPFPLTQPKGSKAAKLEFYAQVIANGTASGTGKRDSVLKVAAVADACDVNLGSCGATAGAINALAGVGDRTCLADASSCNDDSKGPEMFAISGRQRREIYARNCALWDETKMEKGDCIRREGKKCAQYEQITKAEATRRTLVSVWRKYASDPDAKAAEIKSGCFQKNSDATTAIRKYLEEEAKQGRLPSDWPKSWASKLRPGDRLVIYNGNSDLVGSHAVIFVGWASEGKMKVVQGGGGGSGTQKNVTRPGTICITPACGKDSYKPLINGWSPD